jgi:hypothetical protein
MSRIAPGGVPETTAIRPGGPCADGLRRLQELVERQETKLLARLTKLVRPDRSLESLHLELWKRKTGRHAFYKWVGLKKSAERRRQEVGPDHIVSGRGSVS